MQNTPAQVPRPVRKGCFVLGLTGRAAPGKEFVVQLRYLFDAQAESNPSPPPRVPEIIVATTTVLQLACAGLTRWLHHERTDMAGVRAAIEQYLLDWLRAAIEQHDRAREAGQGKIHHEEIRGRLRDALDSPLSDSQAAAVLVARLAGATPKQIAAAAIDMLRALERRLKRAERGDAS